MSVKRFRHHHLSNNAILTVCTSLDHDKKEVKVGWAIFNPNDQRWDRKYGNQLALHRLTYHPLRFIMTEDEPIVCDYISLRALCVILVATCEKEDEHHPSCIPLTTKQAIQLEMVKIVGFLGTRCNLNDIIIIV